MANKIKISFNAPTERIQKEIREIESLGYLVVGSYGNEFDMGNVYEYAHGEDKSEVELRHMKHLINCK